MEQILFGKPVANLLDEKSKNHIDEYLIKNGNPPTLPAITVGCRSEVWAELEPAAADHEAAGRWSLHQRTAPESFHPGKDVQDDQLQSVVTWQVC